MNNIEVQVEVRDGIVIQDGHIDPLLPATQFQNHIIFVSSIGRSDFPPENRNHFLIRVYRHKVFNIEIVSISPPSLILDKNKKSNKITIKTTTIFMVLKGLNS